MIYCQIANINFKISTEKPLIFKNENQGLQGFSCNVFDDNSTDFFVTFHKKNNSKNYQIINFFDSNTNSHNFQIATTNDNREIITVNFFSHEFLKNAKLIIYNNKIDILLSLIDENLTEINAYIFPLLNIALSRILLRKQGLLVHSSVVDDNKNGYLFSAVSGTGKSTIARFFQSKGATIINDDMIALKLLNLNELYAHNIPMPLYLDSPKFTKIKAIFLIEQANENFIEKIQKNIATLQFSTNTINFPLDKISANTHFQTITNIAEFIPIFRLGFIPNSHIVNLIRSLNL